MWYVLRELFIFIGSWQPVYLVLLLLSVPVVAQTDDKSVSLFHQHHYQEAIDILEADLSDPDSRYILGLCYFRLGLLYLEMHRAFLPLATHCYQLLDSLEDYLAEEARPSIHTLFYLGLTYVENEQYEKGIEALENYLSRNSQQFPLRSVYAQCALAESYYQTGNQVQAEATFEEIKLQQQALGEYVDAFLTETYLRLGLESKNLAQKPEDNWNLTTSIGILTENAPHLALAVLWLYSRQVDSNHALTHLKDFDLLQPDLTDSVDELQTHEFFHPRYYRYIGEIYLNQAYHLFSALYEHLPTLKSHLTYANAYILVELNDYTKAKQLLGDAPPISLDDKILLGCRQVLLGCCYYALNQKTEALEIWSQVDTQHPIIAVELAFTYARYHAEMPTSVKLVQQLMKKIPQVSELPPEVYPPLGAFASREVYRRAGNAMLLLSKRKTNGISEPNSDLIDAIQTYKAGHIEAYPYAIDEPPWGNDPSLLVNMADANYKRGFTFWSTTTETYSVMQRSLAELYPLHIMIQKVYAVHMMLHQDIREIEK